MQRAIQTCKETFKYAKRPMTTPAAIRSVAKGLSDTALRKGPLACIKKDTCIHQKTSEFINKNQWIRKSPLNSSNETHIFIKRERDLWIHRQKICGGRKNHAYIWKETHSDTSCDMKRDPFRHKLRFGVWWEACFVTRDLSRHSVAGLFPQKSPIKETIFCKRGGTCFVKRNLSRYGVATISRLLKMLGLFCKRAL